MTDAELDRIMKSATAPEWDHRYWDDFPGRVAARIKGAPQEPAGASVRQGQQQGRAPTFKLPAAAWGIGLAVAGIVVAFAVGFWKGRDSANAKAQRASMQK